MTVTYKDDVSTLDPAIGYDWQNWSMIKSLFDGLMDYEPGTTTLDAGPGGELHHLGRRHGLHLQAPPGGQVPQRARAGRRRREVLDRAGGEAGDAVARRRLLLAPSRGSRSSRRGRPTELVGHQGGRSADRRVHPVAAGRDLPAQDGAELRPRGAEGGGGRGRRRLRAQAGRAPAPTSSRSGRSASGSSSSATRTTGRRGVPKLDQITFEIGQEPTVALLRLQRGEVDILGDGIPPAQFLQVKAQPRRRRDRRGRPAPHRLRHDERQRPALRRREGAAGGQHGDQQGPHRPDHQQPRGAGEPAAAAVDAGLRQGLRGLPLRSGGGEEAPRRGGASGRVRDRALRLQHRPEPAHRPGDPAGPGARSGSRRRSSRWRRPT